MLCFNLALPLPPACHKRGIPEGNLVACTVFEEGQTTLMFLEMPNWADAVVWTAELSLKAWEQWEASPCRTSSRTPADLDHFFLYRVRPGYPEGEVRPWQEALSWYQPTSRSATLVQRLIPVSGTREVRERAPDDLAEVFTRLGWRPQALQHYDVNGLLQ